MTDWKVNIVITPFLLLVLSQYTTDKTESKEYSLLSIIVSFHILQFSVRIEV